MDYLTSDTSTAIISRRSIILRAWLPFLIALAVACGVFGLAFGTEIKAAVRVWTESTAYNHCYLVLPLAAVLLWNRRDVVAAARPTPMPAALIFIPGLALLWLAATLVDVVEAEQLLVVALFEVLLLTILGWRVFRALLAPLLFLFFLVPFGAFLVPSLQQFTSVFATDGLRLVGIPVFTDNLVIEIPEGSFEVAEACAGLRFLIASSVFGCFFATIVYRSNWRRAFFILSSVLAPIIANGLRAFGLIWLAHLEGSATAMEADHVLYGWLFFTLVTLLLIAIGLMLPDRRDEPPIQTSVSSVSYIPRSGLRVAMVVGAALVLIAVGPAWLRASAPASAAPLQATLAEVVPGSDWARAQDDPAGWRPIMQGAGGIFPIAYRDGDMIASAYIVRYRLAAGAKPVSRMLNAIADPEIWQVTDTGRVLVPIDGQKVMVNTAMLKRQGFSRSVWWFYIIDGQMTARSLEARLLHARAALSAGQHLETFVAISAAASNASPDNATLRSFLKSFRAKEPAAPPGSGAISN